MKAIIYQYWDGKDTPGNRAGVEAMREYAKCIGAEHLYEKDPRFASGLGMYTPHYGAFKPVFTDSFHAFDYVLFVDTDVFPVAGLRESIFDQMDAAADIGVCEEWQQPAMRKRFDGHIGHRNDEAWARLVCDRWGGEVPRTDEGLVRVFNSGVVVYSKGGLASARESFVDFREYVHAVERAGLPPFYTCDQPYLHAMLVAREFNWQVLPYRWNSSVHYMPGTSGKRRPVNDLRAGETCFVHVQLRNADNYEADLLRRIVNDPVESWEADLWT